MQKHSSLRNIDRNARLFVQLQVFFDCVTIIESLFVNTFLLKAYGSFSAEVLLYNAIMAIVQPIAMLTALFLSVKKNSQLTQRVSFMFYGMSLLILCVFGENVSFLYPLFAILNSFGAGYYFSIYSAQMLTYTTDRNRDQISGLIAVFGSIISISMPLLSGFLISSFDSFVGYRIVFGLSAFMTLGALLTTAKLPPLTTGKRKTALLSVARTLFGNSKGRWIMVASGLDNCMSSTIPIFVTLLFYNLVPSEWLISVNSAVGSIAALLGASIYYRVIRSDNRIKSSIVAVSAMLVPCVSMLFGLNITLIFIFQAIYRLCSRFLTTPILNTHFKIVEEFGLHKEFGSEVHLIRELFVSSGRLIGLVLILQVPKTNTGAAFVLGCMMLFAIINVLILKKISRTSI